MEAEDVISLCPSRNSGSGSENDEHIDTCHGSAEGDSISFHSEGDKIGRKSMELGEIDVRKSMELGEIDLRKSMELGEIDVRNENDQLTEEIEEANQLSHTSPAVQVNLELTETTVVEEKLSSFKAIMSTDNGCLNVQNSISGVKRARMEFDERQPSVHVVYNSLTSASKHKLEQLLQMWSEWEAEYGSLNQNPDEVPESGEQTFFPAVRFGIKKSSAVSFWIDNQSGNEQAKAVISLDGSTAPLYDRGYAMGLSSVDNSSNVEGGLEIIDDDARCFNCGSYGHSLKECQKPRDNNAVSSARKQLKSKKNQKSGSRLPTRYYQSSAGGKYDDLKPGALSTETQELLGLGELDPPPWLNRMREIGYPPGYLEPDDEDQPSGITIFADGGINDEHENLVRKVGEQENRQEDLINKIDEQEDGEITETGLSEYGKTEEEVAEFGVLEPPRKKDAEIAERSVVTEPRKKMTVKFPGINAPIPKNADDELWAHVPSSDSYRSRSHRLNHSFQRSGRGHRDEERWVSDFRDDGPPGVDQGFNSSSRHGRYDSGHSSREYNTRPRSPPDHSLSDKGRKSPREDHTTHHHSYSSSREDYGSGRYESETYESRAGRNHDSSNRNDYDRYRSRSRR